jgi:hypothetical protein
MQIVTLWRPVGPEELALIRASGMREFPPRLPDQPIFYPVTSEEYAIKIARDWNVPASGAGYVTRFDVKKDLSTRSRSRMPAGAHIRNIGFLPSNFRDSTRRSSGKSRSSRRSHE